MEIFVTRYMAKGQKVPFVATSVALLDLVYENLLKNGHLKYSDIAILLFIAKNERDRTRFSEVSVSYIANGVGCSTATARKGLQRLRDLDLIESATAVKEVNGKSTSKTGYRLKQHTEESYKDFLLAKFATDSPSKNCQGGVVKTTTAVEQKLLGREEDIPSVYEKGGEEGPPPPLRLVARDGQILKEETVALLEEQINLAYHLKNPVIFKSYFQDTSKVFPDCYLPPRSPREESDVISRTTFLKACTVIVEIQRDLNFRTALVPSTWRDVENFGNAVGPFLAGDKWESLFTDFYLWVLENKEDYGFNLLPYYYSDWVSAVSKSFAHRDANFGS